MVRTFYKTHRDVEEQTGLVTLIFDQKLTNRGQSIVFGQLKGAHSSNPAYGITDTTMNP